MYETQKFALFLDLEALEKKKSVSQKGRSVFDNPFYYVLRMFPKPAQILSLRKQTDAVCLKFEM